MNIVNILLIILSYTAFVFLFGFFIGKALGKESVYKQLYVKLDEISKGITKHE